MPRKREYRRPYPPEFRREAVALYARTDKTLGEISADLGVSRESLRLWVQQTQIERGERDGLTGDEREDDPTDDSGHEVAPFGERKEATRLLEARLGLHDDDALDVVSGQARPAGHRGRTPGAARPCRQSSSRDAPPRRGRACRSRELAPELCRDRNAEKVEALVELGRRNEGRVGARDRGMPQREVERRR